MSRPGLLNKVHGQSIFLGGNKYISGHGYVSLDAYCCHFLHSFYLVVSSAFREGELCHGSTLGDPLEKLETDLKGRSFFRDYCVLGQKLNKIGADFK